jgi:hypothetical protein
MVGLGQFVRHVIESGPQQQRDVCIGLRERILENDQVCDPRRSF